VLPDCRRWPPLQSGTCNMIHKIPSCTTCSDAWRPHGRPGQITAATFQLDSTSLVHCTLYGFPRSLHNMTCNTEKVAAVVQHQNVQYRFVLLCMLYDCYFGDRCSLCRRLTYLAAAAACVAALPFLGLHLPGTDEVLRLGWFIHGCKLRWHGAWLLLIAC